MSMIVIVKKTIYYIYYMSCQLQTDNDNKILANFCLPAKGVHPHHAHWLNMLKCKSKR